jgi:DNA polymerase-3 subunit chi
MQSGVRTAISLPDEPTCDALDKLLWQYPATAFIPHCRSDIEEAGPSNWPVLSLSKWPVVLNHGAENGGEKFPHHDLLISLHNECVTFFSRFERVIEIVGQDEEDSRLGRERYKFYKDRGYELRHIDLSKTQNT